MDNSIRLKELQVVNGGLRKKTWEVKIFIFFKMVFFQWGEEDEIIPPLSKGGFIIFPKGIGTNEFCLGWGQTWKVFSWVAWEGKVWLFFKARRWDLKFFPRNYSFGSVRWGVWRKWMSIFFLFYFFVIWWLNEIFFSRKYFIKINILFLGMEKIQHKNLIERTKNYFV